MSCKSCKCRIVCTSKEELNYKGKKIKEYSPYQSNRILHDLQPDNTDFIDEIQVVLRKRRDIAFTTKSLDFLLNRSLEEREFVEFIRKMKLSGFISSHSNNSIRLIDTSNPSITQADILYDYNYTTEEPNETEDPDIELIKPKNRYKYSTKVLYKRN